VNDDHAAVHQPLVEEDVPVTGENVPSTAEENTAAPADAAVGPDQTETAHQDDDVFSRLRAMSVIKEERPTDELGNPIERRKTDSELSTGHEQRRRKTDSAAPSSQARDDEESIEDYMARLLQRVRGISAEIPQSPRESTAPEPEQQSPTEEAPAKVGPRATAPEKAAGLAAMREIANLSARTAIATHSFRRRAFKAWRMLAVAVAVALAGGLLIYFAREFNLLLFGGVITVLISLAAFGRAAYLARKAKLTKRGHDAQTIEQHTAAPSGGADEESLSSTDSQ
jgi:hypothetical protein